MLVNLNKGTSAISGEAAGEKLVAYLDSVTPDKVSYISYKDLGDLYMIIVGYKGDKIPVYVTKDGVYFVQAIKEIPTNPTPQQIQPQTNQEVPKTDKPRVELFVMSYCPFGLQAEKGIIPVFEELGDKIDAKIRFVHYTMHGHKEDEENYRQLCIREEQADKFLNYVKCFVGSGNYSECLNEAGVDKNKLDNCMENKAAEYNSVDSSLSQQYGVQGSPTLVINGVKVPSGRSPQAFLNAICSAFTTKPEECNVQLSSTTPAPGFGYGGSGSDSGNC